MDKLKRIENIKAELARLEEELKQEEFEYPIYKQGPDIISDVIVKFTSLQEGEVVYVGSSHFRLHRVSDRWTPHTNAKVWKDVAFDEERGLYDKQLVWCWDNSYTHARTLRFYDAKNKCAFSGYGKSNWYDYDNCEPYEGTWPEWAIEAYKTLED